MTLTTYRSPNGQTFQLHADAVPVVEPFFNRLNQVYPGYQSAGGYAHRPMRTLDGRNLGGLSTHATGYTLDVKAPDPVLRQMAQEFPHLRWGGKFSHYDPVHFEFGPTAQKYGELPPLNPASLLDPKAAAPVAGPGPQPIAGGGAPMTPTAPITPFDGMMPADVQKHRKLAQLLAGQATDASPVGHWTQALARVVQGGVGGMHDRAATEGERQGQASVANMMAGNPSPQAMMANPYTQDMGKQLWLAQAKGQMAQNTPMAQTELEGARLQNQIRQRQLEKPMDPVTLGQNEAAARRAQIMAAGIDPASPAARAFIASGKMPREDQQPLTATDKKAILEADEMVLNTQGVIKALDEAKVLSRKAYTGPTAQLRGYGGSLIGAEGAQETEELTNLITNNALQQLKATFGAAPTEGERKILLEIQGSVNKAPKVREAIFERARALAENRLKFYSDRAQQMRGGDYFKTPKEQKAEPPVPAAPGGFSIRRLD